MTAPLEIFRQPGSADVTGQTLGLRLAEIRKERGLTLKELSARTGIPISTLSKVQNNQATLTYENLVRLSVGLEVDVGEFFRSRPDELRTARRTIERKDRGRRGATNRYSFEILATELARKRMVPGILNITATSLDEVGGLSRHDGEEFIYVLSGSLKLYTEFYETAVLKAGDSAYIDSTMGHAYLAARKNAPTRILAVCSHAFDRHGD
jgi:transcriptional regulator with XRE-family HTH domain